MTLAQIFAALLVLGALLALSTFLDWSSIATAAVAFAVAVGGRVLTLLLSLYLSFPWADSFGPPGDRLPDPPPKQQRHR